MISRAVKHALDAIHGHFEGIGGDLGEDSLDPLADRGGADEDRHRSIALEHEPRILLRARRTALDIATDRDAVIPPVDQPALQLHLFRPSELGEAPIESGLIVAAIALRLDL